MNHLDLTRRVFSAATLVTALFIAAACGPNVGPQSPLVGGTCTSNQQCSGECITGDSHFPGGFCTVSCNNDAMCPAGTICIDDHGGMCAVACQANENCGSYGRGFVCDARDRRGVPGGALVCRVP